MSVDSLATVIDDYLQRLFSITRSLTGDGNRKTFEILQDILPLEITEYPSGTPVYDWIVPDEWIIRDAYIKDSDGRRLVDFLECNLHLVGYSMPVHQQMTFDELTPRLHVLSGNPEAIPYRTSYYTRNWGFCLTDRQYEMLKNVSGLLEVCVDSDFKPNGAMTVGEFRIPGESEEDFELTMNLMRETRFDFSFLFKYSERSGTYAARKLEDDIPEDVKRRRLKEIIDLQESISAEIFESRVGKTYKVMAQGPSKKTDADWCGRTDDFKMTIFPYREGLQEGDIVEVKITRCTSHTLIGELV